MKVRRTHESVSGDFNGLVNGVFCEAEAFALYILKSTDVLRRRSLEGTESNRFYLTRRSGSPQQPPLGRGNRPAESSRALKWGDYKAQDFAEARVALRKTGAAPLKEAIDFQCRNSRAAHDSQSVPNLAAVKTSSGEAARYFRRPGWKRPRRVIHPQLAAIGALIAAAIGATTVRPGPLNQLNK
ncbi:hypothetical protein MTO96_013297 [Rhipicephalus appendiculatus]